MATTQADLDLVRNQLETKISGVTVEHVNMAQAIGSYGERFNGLEARFDGIEARFGGVDARFEAVDARFEALDMRLDYLSQDMDRRFDEVNRRLGVLDRNVEKLSDKIDNRFGWQAVMMAALGVLVLFGDAVRAAVGV